MAYKLADGTGIPMDVPFTIGTTNYPANWLRLSTTEEKTAAGISEVDDPVTYDSRFYKADGTPRDIADSNAVDGETGELMKDENGNQIINKGVKTIMIEAEKATADTLLKPFDWYVIRKAEKGTAIPTNVTTYRDAVRTACATRETEITNCADTAALVTLYGQTEKDGVYTPNMTQYPDFQ